MPGCIGHSIVDYCVGCLPVASSDGMLVAFGLPVKPRETGCTAVTGSARLNEEIWATALLPPYLLHILYYTVQVVVVGLPIASIALACTWSLWLDCMYVARRCLSRVGLIMVIVRLVYQACMAFVQL